MRRTKKEERQVDDFKVKIVCLLTLIFWFKPNFNPGKLTGATRLFLVNIIYLCLFCNGFFICHLVVGNGGREEISHTLE